MQVKKPLADHIFKSMLKTRQLSGRSLLPLQAASALTELCRSLVQQASLAQVCSGDQPVWAMVKASKLAESLLQQGSLAVEPAMALVDVFARLAASWRPSPECFGVGVGGGAELVAALVPHARVAAHLAKWSDLLWLPARHCLENLCTRRIGALKAITHTHTHTFFFFLFAFIAF